MAYYEVRKTNASDKEKVFALLFLPHGLQLTTIKVTIKTKIKIKVNFCKLNKFLLYFSPLPFNLYPHINLGMHRNVKFNMDSGVTDQIVFACGSYRSIWINNLDY